MSSNPRLKNLQINPNNVKTKIRGFLKKENPHNIKFHHLN
jgi:hypothetical protein